MPRKALLPALLALLAALLTAPTVQARPALPTTADAPATTAAFAVRASLEGEEISAKEVPQWQQALNETFGEINGAVASVVFYPLPFFGSTPEGEPNTIPFAVAWLVVAALFFTVRMRFINLRGFKHAIDVVRGRFTDPNAQGAGEVSHFQALTTALSATVGLGNIAGVAIAISLGGPGATFWMVMAGLLGMSSKFVECSLGQMYRQERADGHVMGGAMFYLSRGLSEMGLGLLGKPLAVLFAVLCIGGSIAGGNSFQVNQSLGAIGATVPWLQTNGWVYGLVMTVLAGVVIIGGIKRIAQVAEKIVPTMCAIYVAAALFILVTNAGAIPGAVSSILAGAFTPAAGYGGFIGVLITGFKRAAFSNEAGVGSAAIAHSAAKTDYPVREGIVALLEPFIDTVVVCTMTALVIVITGAYSADLHPEWQQFVKGDNGAALTSAAMGAQISWFPYLLSIAVALFAFSTMISWSYYGERCWSYLFGESSSIVYKLIFLAFTFLGSILSATNMLEFGDLMIFGMCIPNILGVYFLSGKVRRALDDYWGKYTRGELPTYD
jgi:AGCS family alanine or glycine:cation symporter